MRSKTFNDLFDSINKNIPKDWLELEIYENRTHELTEPQIHNLTEQIKEIEYEFFKSINTSVLLGEYVFTTHITEKIEEIKELLTERFEFGAIIEPEKKADLLFSLFSKLRKILFTSIQAYLQFIKRIKEKLKFKTRATFDQMDIIFDILELNDLDNSNVILFSNNLKVAFYDHFLRPDKEDIIKLYDISRKLTIEKSKLAKTIKAKCDFLICKAFKRRKKLKLPIINIYEPSSGKIFEPENHFTNPIWDYWKDYITDHYEFGDWKKNVSKRFNESGIDNQNWDCDGKSLLEIHTAIKYAKDVLLDQDGLKKIVLYLKAKVNTINESNEFDERVYQFVYFYAYNNLFSLLIENKSPEIESVYEELITIQKTTDIGNFFPQHKYFKHLVNNLPDTITNENQETVVSDIKKCENILKLNEENIEWSKVNLNYVFQLPFKECFVNINNSENGLEKIFIASSFMLPLDSQKTIDNLSQKKREFDDKRILLSSALMVKKGENKLNKFIEEIKKKQEILENQQAKLDRDISDKDVKSMETLGVFTAIVSFVIATIPNFKFIDSAISAFIFMLTLSISLSIFVLTLILSLRDKKTVNNSKIYIIIFLIIAAFIWYWLIKLDISNSIFKEKDIISSEQKSELGASKIENSIFNTIQSGTTLDLKINDTLNQKK